MLKTLKQKKYIRFVLTLTKNKGRYTAQLLLHLNNALTLFVIISTMRRAARARQKIEQYAAQEVARTLTKNQSRHLNLFFFVIWPL